MGEWAGFILGVLAGAFVMTIAVGILIEMFDGGKPTTTTFQITGSVFMRQFPETRADDEVLVIPGDVTDAEGGIVDPQPALECVFTSSNEEIVSGAVKGDLALDDPRRAALTDLAPGKQVFVLGLHYGKAVKDQFSVIKAAIEVSGARELGAHDEITEQVALFVGDPAAISPARFVFPGDVVAVAAPTEPAPTAPAPAAPEPAAPEPAAPEPAAPEPAAPEPAAPEPAPAEPPAEPLEPSAKLPAPGGPTTA